MKKNIFLFFILFLISRYSFALVDYTETSETPPAPIRKLTPSGQTVSAPVKNTIRQNSAPSGMFELSARYGSIDAEVGERSGKLNVTSFDAHFETSYNIWLDASWSMASFDAHSNIATGSSQKGNPKLLLGVTWLEFGGGAERATIDFVAGANLGQKNSVFATSRTDKIVGVETSKRFDSFVFGLGYRVWLTSAPKTSEEIEIGNVQRLSASLGWMVSPDIRFALEAATVKVGNSKTPGALAEPVSFGTIAPTLQLSLSPMVALELGAVFRSKRLKDESLLGARLWNLPGSYGNSLFAGLGISL